MIKTNRFHKKFGSKCTYYTNKMTMKIGLSIGLFLGEDSIMQHDHIILFCDGNLSTRH